MLAGERPGLTFAEAAEWLDPPITHHQLAIIVNALRIEPVGRRQRPPGMTGRPANVYDAATLLRLHSALVPWL